MRATRRYKAVLFDLDGTLLDTLDDLADSMNAVLARMSFPPHPREAYKAFVGDGLANLVRRALPADRRDEKTVARVVAEQRRQYGAHWADKTSAYDGISELLDALAARGVAMAILSNKPDDFTRLCVEKLLGRWKFAAVRGETGAARKPDPAGALAVAGDMGVPPAEFLYLGDTDTDMRTAVAAGMFPVGALWGFRSGEELLANGARALVRRPMDVLTLLG